MISNDRRLDRRLAIRVLLEKRDDLLLVTGALAFAGALCALLLIRSRALSPSQQSVRSQPSVQAGRTEPQGNRN